MLLSLLWAVEAYAGSRVSLLTFEGDRARSIRWRVAQALKRGGHTVLGFAPPSVRGSAAALRDYAEYRNVDLFVSGSSEEGPDGLQLELRFRGSDGKPAAQPLRFEADDLRGLVRELKGDGLTQLDGVVRGNTSGNRGSESAELPRGRALPLPKRRARPERKVDDRPVLPGAAPGEDEPESTPRKRPREIDLDQAVAGPGGGEAWDADGDEPSEPRRERRARGRSSAATAARRAVTERRGASSKKSSVLRRLAAAEPAASGESAAIDLDADTRGALEESPEGAAAARDAAESALAAEGGGSPEDPEPISIDDEPLAEPAAKPRRKKRGLFAGKLSRDGRAGDEARASGAETTLEDREPADDEEQASGKLPDARLSARAGWMRRSLSYTDDLYNRLRTPTTNGWVYRLDAALFPFARPLKDRLSLIGSYEAALAGTVQDDRVDRSFAVSFSELEGGLRYQQPLGQHELGVQLTAGKMSAGLDASASVSGVPEVSYTLLTPAVAAGLHFGAVTFRASAAYQYTLGGLGELASAEWFPRAQGTGFKGQIGLEYQLSRNVALQASGALRRFVLEMNSRPEDAREGQAEVAGGAVDLYTSGYFGLAFTL